MKRLIKQPFGEGQKGTTAHTLNSLYYYGVSLEVVKTLVVEKFCIKKIVDEHFSEQFADYKYFDGIESPLFRFANKVYRQKVKLVKIDKKSFYKPVFSLSLSIQRTACLSIEGDYVTQELYNLVLKSFTDDSKNEWFNITRAAQARFTEGKNKPNEKVILIEFLNPSKAQNYIDKLNKVYIPNFNTKVKTKNAN